MSKVFRTGDTEYAVLKADGPPVLLERCVEFDGNGEVYRSRWMELREIPIKDAEAILTFFKEQSQ